MKKLFIILTLVIFAVPVAKAENIKLTKLRIISFLTSEPQIKTGICNSDLYLVSGEFSVSGTTTAGNVKVRGFTAEGQALSSIGIPCKDKKSETFCEVHSEYNAFYCGFSVGDNIGLTASTPVIIKFYDGNELLGETKPPLDLTSAVKGIDAIGDMSESIFDKDEWVSKHDTDGDGIMNSEDDFSTYANADGSSPVSLSISYDECSSATKNKIKLTPQKTIDPVTTTNSYQILIDLPEFGSIKDDADGKTITSTEEYTFACEEKNTESSAEKSVPLWGGTVKGFKLSYTCTIDGDLKGNEKIPVSFLYEYTDKDGSEPSTCLFTLGKGKEVNLASSVIPTPIGGGGSSDASGGDCSLNVAASTHGFGWLVDMLVLGLPAVLVGRRRNKIQ